MLKKGMKPGHVFIGISANGKEEVHEFHFAASRTGSENAALNTAAI